MCIINVHSIYMACTLYICTCNVHVHVYTHEPFWDQDTGVLCQLFRTDLLGIVCGRKTVIVLYSSHYNTCIYMYYKKILGRKERDYQ